MSNVETIVVGYSQGEDVYELEFVPTHRSNSMSWDIQTGHEVIVYESGTAVGFVRDVKYVYRSTQDAD